MNLPSTILLILYYLDFITIHLISGLPTLNVCFNRTPQQLTTSHLHLCSPLPRQLIVIVTLLCRWQKKDDCAEESTSTDTTGQPSSTLTGLPKVEQRKSCETVGEACMAQRRNLLGPIDSCVYSALINGELGMHMCNCAYKYRCLHLVRSLHKYLHASMF